MVQVWANRREWHSKLPLSPGNNEISVSGTWTFDPGRGPIGPGGNGTPANRHYPKPSPAGEGCLLVKVNGGGIEHFSSDQPIVIAGPGSVKFKMNDNNHRDNSGSLEVRVRALSAVT